jgi:hypothetical protein
MAKKSTMLALLHEHNTLNGFWFVLIEFILVALVTLLIGAAELSKGRVAWAAGYFGIGANAVAICVTVIGQMRRGEQSSSITMTYFGKGKEVTRREHPDLDRHTLELVIATLVPFLLAARTLREMTAPDVV